MDRGGPDEPNEPLTLRKIFVDGLNRNTADATLGAHFSQYGEVTDIVKPPIKDNRKKGFGFVTYATAEQVDACLNARPHIIDGNVLEVKRAMTYPKLTGDTEKTKKLFVANLGTEVDTEDLGNYLGQFCMSKLDCIENVEVVMAKDEYGRKTDKSTGYGFVMVSDYDSADKIAYMRKYEYNGRGIEVKKSITLGDEQIGYGGYGGK